MCFAVNMKSFCLISQKSAYVFPTWPLVCPSEMFLSVFVNRRGQERDYGLYESLGINHVTMEEEEGWVPPGPAQCAACSAPQCTTTPSTTILSIIVRFMDWCGFPVPLILAMF